MFLVLFLFIIASPAMNEEESDRCQADPVAERMTR
jgi:hypothetical protein